MAQSSTQISGQKTFKSAITVTEGCTFTSTSGTNKIAAASTSLAALSVRDLITITGTTSNNATFTVKSVDSNGTFITVEETVTAETSDGSTDTVLTYSGFVTEPAVFAVHFARTQTKFPVKFTELIVVLWSVVNVVLSMSK